jgi:hypothetical protein
VFDACPTVDGAAARVEARDLISLTKTDDHVKSTSWSTLRRRWRYSEEQKDPINRPGVANVFYFS